MTLEPRDPESVRAFLREQSDETLAMWVEVFGAEFHSRSLDGRVDGQRMQAYQERLIRALMGRAQDRRKRQGAGHVVQAEVR